MVVSRWPVRTNSKNKPTLNLANDQRPTTVTKAIMSINSTPVQSGMVLVVFLVICFGAAAIGSVFTSSSVDTWYMQLQKPAFNPPKWIFGPVWSVLYFLMAVSAWLVWRSAGWKGGGAALMLFWGQLGLNVAWSGVFFGLRQPGIALLVIFSLLATIIATAVAFLPLSRTAFWLMTPYAAWVSFASLLNFAIWRLNLGAA